MAEGQRKTDEIIRVDQVLRGGIQIKLRKHAGKNTYLPFAVSGFPTPPVKTEISAYADQGGIQADAGRTRAYYGEGILRRFRIGQQRRK